MIEKKKFTTAPLPFMGQKRRFLKLFKEDLLTNKKASTYVDLFGGSGLLAHTIKNMYPDVKVVYNDYDNYQRRINTIPKTNKLLEELREITKELPKDKRIIGKSKESIMKVIENYESKGFVDYITLSSSILFSMNYVTSFEQLKKQTLYNCVRKNNYNATGYLDGLSVVSMDYKAIFEEYKTNTNVVFLVDPPYLSTEVGSYKNYRKLKDYLDVLNVLKGTNYYYFTSNKSNIVELCDWIESQVVMANPFHGAKTYTYETAPSYNTTYTDMMLVKYSSDVD